MPIIYDIDQGSPDWFLIRMGVPTASEFSRAMTGANRQFSTAAHTYAHEKIAEMITGLRQGGDYVSPAMEMGHITEQEAADSYEFANDVKTEIVGFMTDDDGLIGASPDRLVGLDGGVEIKRKEAPAVVDFLLKGRMDEKHRAQVQGNMLVTGRLWWDWHLYNPDMPRMTVRVPRDERYISDLRQDLYQFKKLINVKLRTLAEAGYIDIGEIAARAVRARAHIKGRHVPAPFQYPAEQSVLGPRA